MNEHIIRGVELPQIRHCLIMYLLDLSDAEYQKAAWIIPGKNTAFYYGLLGPIGLILEEQDLDIEGRARGGIGGICKNEEEADAVQDVAKLLDELTEKIYEDDDFYLNSPIYPKLVQASKEAYEIFMKSEQDNKKFLKFMEKVKENMRKKIAEKRAETQ